MRSALMMAVRRNSHVGTPLSRSVSATELIRTFSFLNTRRSLSGTRSTRPAAMPSAAASRAARLNMLAWRRWEAFATRFSMIPGIGCPAFSTVNAAPRRPASACASASVG